MNKKILILGASSYVGRALFERIGPSKAAGTYCTTARKDMIKFDSINMDIASVIKRSSEYSHAVILLGDTVPQTCAEDVDRSRRLNVESIKKIIDYLVFSGIKPVFTSSDYVFDGERGMYSEEDLARPIIEYGRQKLEVENYLSAKTDDYLILRLSKVFGSTFGDGTILTNWIYDIPGKASMKCAEDQVFSPVYIEDVIDAIIRAIQSKNTGLYHVSGPKSYSRLELMNVVIKALEKRIEINIDLEPCSLRDFDLNEDLPLNVSMDSSKLVRTFGLSLTSAEDVCEQLVMNLDFQFLDKKSVMKL